MRNTKRALLWIVKILKAHDIPFLISGGFAAKVYGSNRPLFDIDIDIPENEFKNIFDDVENYIRYGPKKYKDKNWDLLLMTLEYNSQIIDVCGAYKTKIFNKTKKEWVLLKNNLKNKNLYKIYGISVPLTPVNELMRYKLILGRRVDLIDIKNLKKIGII